MASVYGIEQKTETLHASLCCFHWECMAVAYSTVDDRVFDLLIMYKPVREMTGTLFVGSLKKQAMNLQGNNNDSSQRNKGHPPLPVVINLTQSSIGGVKKCFPSPPRRPPPNPRRSHSQQVLQPASLICNLVSHRAQMYSCGFYMTHFPIISVMDDEKNRSLEDYVS